MVDELVSLVLFKMIFNFFTLTFYQIYNVQLQNQEQLEPWYLKLFQLPSVKKIPKKRVVITGMGLVSVFGSGIDTFYDKLLEGESGISLIDRFDASSFSVRFAGQIRDFSSKGCIDGKNDRRLDDCWRYCLVAGKRALADANHGSEVLENVSFCLLSVVHQF